MATVTWEKVEPGIWKRTGADGRAIYRAVRQAGKDLETGKYLQETETFNGGKIQGALREARTWRSEGRVQLSKGPRTRTRASAMTLREAFDARQNDTDDPLAPKTKSVNEGYLRALVRADPSIEGRKLREIDSEYIRAVLKRIEAPSMREHVRVLVSSIYSHAEVTPNPALRRRRRRTRAAKVAAATAATHRYLDDGTVERLIAAVPNRYRMLIRLMWRAGLRPGEALALTVGQVDPATNELTVDRAVSSRVLGETKTGQVRHPILAPSVAAALSAHIRQFSDWSDPDRLVFTTEDGDMIDLDNWRRRTWRPACEAAGVDADVYDLRHTFCSNAVHAGVDLVSVAEAAGHSVAVLASTYLHYDSEAGRRAAQKLETAYGDEASLPAVGLMVDGLELD
jgi:integrase